LRHGGGYETHYLHLSRFASGLAVGDRVRQKEIIGYVGSTGLASGPHLHFSILEGEEYVDPLGVTPPPRIVQSVSLDEGFQRSRGVLLAALDRLAGDGPVRLTRVSGPRVETPERPLLISY
ncbi:MAG: M23 family metallopeptidase, partial [Alphaproteobacteria bacterium]